MSSISENNNKKNIVYIDSELSEIIPKFIENRNKDIIKIKEALGMNDFQTIRILGHNMKGSGGGYGFDYISEIGKLLQFAAESNDSEQIMKCVDELDTYIKNIEINYK